MRPSTPIIHAGKVYDKYAVFLSSAPLITGATCSTMANLSLKPMRVNEEGNPEILQEASQTKQILLADVKAGTPEELEAYAAIEAAIQKLIDLKGL